MKDAQNFIVCVKRNSRAWVHKRPITPKWSTLAPSPWFFYMKLRLKYCNY